MNKENYSHRNGRLAGSGNSKFSAKYVSNNLDIPIILLASKQASKIPIYIIKRNAQAERAWISSIPVTQSQSDSV